MKCKYRMNIRFGGIYSNVVIGIQYLQAEGFNIEDCYLNIIDLDCNPLDYVLDQELEEDFEDVRVDKMPTYHHKNRIDEDTRYSDLKVIANKLPYKKELLDLVDKYVKEFNINENTLAVHMRLCDMNIVHKDSYGYLTYEDYITAINKEINSDTTLFVASDNLESIEKLKRDFNGKVSYVPDMIRGMTETENTCDLQLNNFTKKELWVEAFTDMLLLSKCSRLVCRTSNLANMAIITSNTLNKIIMM